MLLLNQNRPVDAKSVNAALIALDKRIGKDEKIVIEKEYKEEGTSIELDDNKITTENVWSASKVIATCRNYYNEQSATANKTIVLEKPLEKGMTVSILFANGHDGSSLTVNGKAVKVNKQGSLINIPTHTINEVVKCIQPYTTLDLMYDGAQFIVMGNPIVLSGGAVDESANYTVKADGFIEQHYRKLSVGSGHYDLTFIIAFSNKNYFVSSSTDYSNSPKGTGIKNTYTEGSCRLGIDASSSGNMLYFNFYGY